MILFYRLNVAFSTLEYRQNIKWKLQQISFTLDKVTGKSSCPAKMSTQSNERNTQCVEKKYNKISRIQMIIINQIKVLSFPALHVCTMYSVIPINVFVNSWLGD